MSHSVAFVHLARVALAVSAVALLGVGCGHSEASAGATELDGLLRDYGAPTQSHEPVGMSASSAGRAEAKPISRSTLAATYELAGDPSTEPVASVAPPPAAAPAPSAPPSAAELEDAVAAETGTTPAPAVERAAATPEKGATLAIKLTGKKNKRNSCTVKVGKRRLGPAPIAEARLAAGTHRVHVMCKDKREYVDTVTLEPGEHEELTLKVSDLKKRVGRRTARR